MLPDDADYITKVAPDVGNAVFATAIWCLACHNNFVIAGCRNGSVEVTAAPSLLSENYYVIDKFCWKLW
jgi:hypothetical protein